MLGDDVFDRLAAEDDIIERLPRPLDEDERIRLGHLITDAVEVIAVAFDDAGRDLAAELATDYKTSLRPLHAKVRWAIREMVSAAVLIGPNAGMRSVSSTTGAQSDSVTFSDVGAASWSGISLTDQIRDRLGLLVGVRPRGRFPKPLGWPEVVHDARPWQ